MKFHFQPKHLENVLSRIREEHPNRSGQEIKIGQSIISKVTEQLKLCSYENYQSWLIVLIQ